MRHEREKAKRKSRGVKKLIGRRKLTGGYGGESGKAGRKADGCYKDSGDEKVKEKSSIIAAEFYIDLGMYVVFLHQDNISRTDLLVNKKLLVEVKGVVSLNPGQISRQIKKASQQIESEHSKYPEDKRLPAKIVIISLHKSLEIGFQAINAGYQEAKRKNQVHFPVEFWFRGESGMKIRVLE